MSDLRIHSPSAHTQPGSADRWADLEQLARNSEHKRCDFETAMEDEIKFRRAASPATVLELIAAARASAVGTSNASALTPPDPKATEVADRLMQDFYLSPAYDPKAARPADTVKAAIAFTLAMISTAEQGRG